MISTTCYRSLLFVPGHKTDWVPKAVAAEADAVVLDLEDSVPDERKATARHAVAESIRWLGSEAPHVAVYVRPNRLQTGLLGFDLAAVVTPGLHGLFIPKIDDTNDIVRCEALIDHFERANETAGVGLIVPLETAPAIADSLQIARASTRLHGMVAATARYADIARAIGYRQTDAGTETLYHRSRAVINCRAVSVQPITGLWEDVRDLEGLREFARRGRDLGFTGQIVIHPSHVSVVNEAYALDAAEISFYEGLIEAFEDARRRGDGAVVYRGQHIDQAHAETARERIALAARSTL